MTNSYKVPVWLAVIMNVNVMMGAGVFINTAYLAENAGIWSILGYLMVGVAIIPLVLVISQLAASHTASFGGLYHYIRDQLGEGWGQASSVAYAVAKSSAIAALAYASALYIQYLIPTLASCSVMVLGLSIVSVLALFNALGTRFGSSAQFWFMLFKALPIVLVIGGALWIGKSAQFSLVGKPTALADIAPLAFYGIMGFEMCCSTGHTIAGGKKNLARVVILSFLLVLSTCSVFQLGMWAVLGEHLMGTPDPLGLFCQRMTVVGYAWSGMASLIVRGAVLCSMLGGCFGILYANIWNWYALAAHHWPPAAGYPAMQIGRRGIPTAFLCGQWIFSSLLLVSGLSLIALQKLAVFGVVATYTMSVLTLISLKRAQPGQVTLSSPVIWVSLVPCGYLMAICLRDVYTLMLG